MSSFIIFALLTLFGVRFSKGQVTGDHITIHIVTHTHDDTGWIITTDEYYIQEVQWIFTTMIPVLMENPERKFTYVEMAYFYRWWNEQDDDMKQNVRKLIDNGQLQLNLAGWCMNDEANPSLTAIVRQMTDGSQFALNSFGPQSRPTTAWHVDPFGHSWVTGGLWSEAGFDTFAVHRINQWDLAQRKKDQNLEFIWKGSTSLGTDGYIFFHILDSGYCTPSEINFPGGGAYINIDPRLPTYGLDYVQIAESFVSDARNRNSWFAHEHILIPYGCDFQHTNAHQSMDQMDKLIAYINSNSTYNATILYSTLADYTLAVNNLNLTWELEDNDFFDYVDNDHSWWTGYFTSRPLQKSFTRSRENIVRPAEQLYLFGLNMNLFGSINTTEAMKDLMYLRHAIDVAQHHDGITGTETTHTRDDYMTMLQRGTNYVNSFMENSAPLFLAKNSSTVPTLSRDESTISSLTSSSTMVIVLYNSLGWQNQQIVQVPSNFSSLTVTDVNGNVVTSQVNENAEYQDSFTVPAQYTLYFLADLAPLAFSTYFVALGSSEDMMPTKTRTYKDYYGEDIVVGDGEYELVFDGTTSLLKQVNNNAINKRFVVNNTWHQYTPTGGIYSDGDQNSGAYIFRPAQDNRFRVGSNSNNPTNPINFDLAFRETFESSSPMPGFIVNAHGNARYNDSFASTVCGYDLDSNEFTFRYYRVNGNDWGQNPYFDFLVFDSSVSAGDNPHEWLVNREYGIESVNAAASPTSDSISVSFPTAYSNTPGLLISPRSSDCNSQSSYSVILSSITTNGATAYARRIDSNTNWNENIYLDWLSWDITDTPQEELRVSGTAQFQLKKSQSNSFQVNITFTDADDYVVNEPVVLYSIRQVSPTIQSNTDVVFITTTTVSNGHKGFAMIVDPVDGAPGVDVTYEVSYIAIERRILYTEVLPRGTYPTLTKTQTGPLLTEVHQVWKTNYSQSYRVYNSNDSNLDLQYIDMQVHLGAMDQGAEFITRFSTELDGPSMWTGQNSLEYVERTYDPYITERIGGNYFPTASISYLTDTNDNYRFSTIVDVAHGVASLREGETELMLHRRCLSDDSRGVNQVLNETTHIEPRIFALIDESDTVSYQNRRLQAIQQFPAAQFYAITDTRQNWVRTYNTDLTFMSSKYKNGLPDNINILEFRYAYSGNSWNEGLLLQLQHMFETNENSQYSVDETIDLTQIFNSNYLNITQGTEMQLTSFVPLADVNKLSWNVQTSEGVIQTNGPKQEERRLKYKLKDDLSVTLAPRQIRTFLINDDPVTL